MKSLIVSAIALSLLLPTLVWAGQPLSVDNTPPVVIQTVPAAGDKAVDAKTKEIKITFSKDMMTEKMWSLVIVDKVTFPKIAGTPKYQADKRTIAVPVSLKPGQTYALWINKGKNNAFKDTRKLASVPYLLVFETKK